MLRSDPAWFSSSAPTMAYCQRRQSSAKPAGLSVSSTKANSPDRAAMRSSRSSLSMPTKDHRLPVVSAERRTTAALLKNSSPTSEYVTVSTGSSGRGGHALSRNSINRSVPNHAMADPSRLDGAPVTKWVVSCRGHDDLTIQANRRILVSFGGALTGC